jgi:hypothetical protein
MNQQIYLDRIKKREDKFWALVDIKDADDCWLWKGSISGGYGHFSGNGVNMPAHRYSYKLKYKSLSNHIGYKRMVVRHLCGNKLCVNPKHLLIGSQSNNTLDYYSIDNYKHLTFSKEEIQSIRRFRASGKTYREIGKMCGHHEGTIRRVVLGIGSYRFIQ